MTKKGLSRKELGNLSESLAAEHLTNAGLKLVMRNYRCPKGEIDIIARDGDQLVFVEVRSKTSQVMGWAEESIDSRKRQKLRNCATYYVMEQGCQQWPSLRIDLLAVNWTGAGCIINWLKGID